MSRGENILMLVGYMRKSKDKQSTALQEDVTFDFRLHWIVDFVCTSKHLVKPDSNSRDIGVRIAIYGDQFKSGAK